MAAIVTLNAMADVTERMLRLLATLQGGGAFTGEELAARLGVSQRTLRRDAERLRGYGYPVDARPGPGGAYRLSAGQRMPPLVLDDDEAIATVAALATLAAAVPSQPGGLVDAAARAYGKIDALLPSRLRSRAAALRVSIETERRSAPDIAADTLGELAEAIAAREVVVFDYLDARGTKSHRRVEAHRQVHVAQRWSVFCWDLDRGDWRVFRTDRITNLSSTGIRYRPRTLPADSTVAYLRSGIGERVNSVRIMVRAPLPAVADVLRYEGVELESTNDGHTQATVAVDAWQRLLAPLAYLDADFRVDAPRAVSSAMERFARRLATGSESSSAETR